MDSDKSTSRFRKICCNKISLLVVIVACLLAIAHRSLIVEEYMIYSTGMTSTSVFNQGVRHFHGIEGKEKNIKLAVKYFRRAAKRGFPEALYQLGICYANGVGVEENEIKALKYFLLAAHSPKGHAQAAVNVGRFYHQGIGVEVDEALGCHYFKLAADAGDSKSQAMMGTCYADVQGFPRDYELAYQYFKLAADAGVELAKTELDRLFNSDGTPKSTVNPNSQ